MRRDKRKQSGRKKTMLVFLGILAVVLVVVELIFVKQYIEGKAYQKSIDYVEKVESQDAQVSNVAVNETKEDMDGVEVITYYPANKEKVSESNTQQALDAYKKDTLSGNIKAMKDNNVERVYLKSHQTACYRGIKLHKFFQSTYQRKNNHLVQKDLKEVNHIYVQEGTQQVVTVNDLFANPDTAKQEINQILNRVMEEKQIAPEKQDQIREQFAADKLPSLEFSYANKLISFELPKELAQDNFSKLDIELKTLYPYLKGDMVPEAEETDYQKYLEEVKSRTLVALTFDDGPSRETTAQILDILARYKMHATFFLLGKNIPGNEDLVQRMINEGHQVGNHSWSHPELTKVSSEEAQAQIQQTQDAISKATGRTTASVVRPPYGSINHSVASVIKLPAVNWSVDTLDWKSHNPAAILEVVKKTVYPGAIVLMHDIHQTTVDSLPAVLEYLRDNNYKGVTINELYHSEPLQAGRLYFDDKTSNGL